MHILPANVSDIEQILRIYEDARLYMRKTGNAHQWAGGYPSREILMEDLAAGRLFLCVEGEEILGVFCFFIGEDPTYRVIEGAWTDDRRPYGVIHRIAVAASAHGRGVAAFCFAYAMERAVSVRIDTHRDNRPMQRALEKNGFVLCGIIHLANGDPRLAYQKIRAEGGECRGADRA